MLNSWNWIVLTVLGAIVLVGGILLAIFVGGRVWGAPIGLGLGLLILALSRRFGSARLQAKMRGEDPDSDAHPGPSLLIPDPADPREPTVFAVPAPRPSKLFNEKGQANDLFGQIVTTGFAVLVSLGGGIWFAVAINLIGGLVILAVGLLLTTLYVVRFARIIRKGEAPDGSGS